MPKVTVNGCDFNVVDRGTGPAVVLLHGFPLDGRMWDAQVQALSDRFRVIVPDLRGFGESRSSDPFTIDSLALDVQALLADQRGNFFAMLGFQHGKLGFCHAGIVHAAPARLQGGRLLPVTRPRLGLTTGRRCYTPVRRRLISGRNGS